MGLEEGEQKRGYLSGCETKLTNSFFCGSAREVKSLIECLLGAAARIETSSKSLLHASLHARRWYDFPPVL